MDPSVKPEGDAAVWAGRAVPHTPSLPGLTRQSSGRCGELRARNFWMPGSEPGHEEERGRALHSVIAGLDPAIQGGRPRARGSGCPDQVRA